MTPDSVYAAIDVRLLSQWALSNYSSSLRPNDTTSTPHRRQSRDRPTENDNKNKSDSETPVNKDYGVDRQKSITITLRQ